MEVILEHIGFVYLVMDWEGEASCAATTEAEAKEIVEESERDGNVGHRIERVYLFGRAPLTSTCAGAPYYMGGEAKEMILVALRAMIGRIKHDGASDWQNHMKYDMLLRQLVTMFNLAPDISPSTTPISPCTGLGAGWCDCPPDTEGDTTGVDTCIGST